MGNFENNLIFILIYEREKRKTNAAIAFFSFINFAIFVSICYVETGAYYDFKFKLQKKNFF